MFEDLKEKAYLANMRLTRENLIKFTWGNASETDREKGVMAIKPSGVAYELLCPGNMVLIDIETGKQIEKGMKPSSDLPTHLVLARNFNCGGIVHTHSRWATVFAQAGKNIKAYGTTHADVFYGDIPCTREMTPEEIKENYEYNTGLVITETFKGRDETQMPAALVHSHGPFTWGANADKAVTNAAVLEEVAMMAAFTELLGNTTPISQELLDKHFLRKHGKNAYYGQ